VRKEQEEEERLRRKRIMNLILEEHYEGEASMNISVPSKKQKTNSCKPIKYKCSKCEFCTSNINEFKRHEVSDHAKPKLKNENFYKYLKGYRVYFTFDYNSSMLSNSTKVEFF